MTAPPASTNDDPFASLSHQLVSHGYLSRPLLLSSLVLDSPSSSSSSSFKKHQESLVLRARAQDQVHKLLWSLLERNESSRQEVRESVERESRLVMEYEREKALRERRERDTDQIERELEKERAKTKELETKLKGELERSKHVREELTKSRNALQFTKTQALHDQKKREQEVNQLHLRLSKLGSTSDGGGGGGGTRIQILNATTLSNGGSSSSPSSSSSPLLGHSHVAGGRSTVNSRRNGSSPRSASSSPPDSSLSISLLTSELNLLKSSVSELEQTRVSLSEENLELRTFIGELEDWVERLLSGGGGAAEEGEGLRELDLFARQQGVDGEEEEQEEEDEDRKEARVLLERLRIETAKEAENEACLIPTPHLTLSPRILVARLDTKLYVLRLALLSSLRSVEKRLALERERSRRAVECEIEARDQEIEKRQLMELEVQEMKKVVEEGRILVEEFVEARNGRGGAGVNTRSSNDDSADELPDDIVRELQERKQKKTSSSKLTAAEIEKPSTLTTRPSIPSQSVQDFLGSLGLDTPVAATATLKSDRVANAQGGGGRGVGRAEKGLGGVGDARKKRPSTEGEISTTRDKKGKEKETFKNPSSSSSHSTRPSSSSTTTTTLSARPLPSSSTGRDSVESSSVPSSSSSSNASNATISTTTTTSAALQSILSLALSPPSTSEPLTSSKLAAVTSSSTQPTQPKVPSTARGTVLGNNNRVGNSSTTTASGANEVGRKKDDHHVKSREELVREKKARLMNDAARKGSRPVQAGAAGTSL